MILFADFNENWSNGERRSTRERSSNLFGIPKNLILTINFNEIGRNNASFRTLRSVGSFPDEGKRFMLPH